MPEVTVVEPKPPVTPPPPKPPSASQKFREAFAKIEPDTPPPVEPTPKEGEGESTAVKPTVTAPIKPSSALEAAIGTPEGVKTESTVEADLDFSTIEKPTSDHWSRARQKMEKQGARIKELEATPPPNGAAEAIAAERDQLKERLTDQESRLKAINAEYSDEFQGLQKDREKALGKIASRMKYVGAAEKAQDLVDALNLPEGRFKTQQIKEALTDLEADDKAAVRVLIEGLDTVDEKISDFRKDLPAQWDKIRTERERKIADMEVENMKVLDREFTKVVSDLPKDIARLRLVPEDVPGAAEWNKPIKEAIDGALAALKPDGADFRQTTETVIKGKLYDGLWTDHIAMYKELQEAKKRLSEFDSAGPDIKGIKKPKAADVAKKPSQKFHEAMAAQQATDD